MPIGNFLSSMGITYIVKRDFQQDRTETGLINTEQSSGRAYIGFMPGTDIKPDDVLINPSGDQFYVIETLTDSFSGKPHQLKAYYQTKREHDSNQQACQSVFHIQNAYGSVIGNNNQATINYNSTIENLKDRVSHEASSDKDDMEKIVSLLEMVVNNQVPPTKGLFSKFSEVMERHSWLSNSVAATVLGWLISKIP